MHFFDKISPVFGKTRIQIPPPTNCPDCRLLRRTSWRNEYCYYQRKCSCCGKSIVSVFSPEKNPPVFCHSCWWGDAWDPLSYAREYDPGRSFFEQFLDLQQVVPQLCMMNDNGVSSENCEYCNDFAFGKNCYLVTGSWQAHDCLYSSNCNHVKDIVDCDCVNIESELVYESVDSQRLYSCGYLQSSSGCNNCYFGIDLRGCSDCICCVGLRQRKYCYFNEQLTEEQYRQKLSELDLGSYQNLEKLKQEFSTFSKQFPRKANQLINCEDCSGDNLYNCRGTKGFDLFNAEFSKYFIKGDSPKHCYDIHNSGGCQWCYDCVTPDNSYQVAFSLWCWKSKNIFYSDNCHSSEWLFGCIGMKRAKYCLLNKQYSEEEFNKIIPSVVESMQKSGDWGGFFPAKFAPFGYNESLASDIFPKSREEVSMLGLPWSEREVKASRDQSHVLVDRLDQTSGSVTKELLSCNRCSKNYKITALELDFHRKIGISLPRACPECRRSERQSLRPKYSMSIRNCANCSCELETGYSESQVSQIMCENCYLVQLHK